MQKKKTKIIIIAMIVLLILILIAGISYAFLATDLFKSNKELFFHYVGQMGDNEKGFLDQELKQYFEKQSNTPYTDEGSLKVAITTSNGQDQFDYTNNMNLTYQGEVDQANQKNKQDLTLNYSDSVKFPVSYQQIGNTIGMQTSFVGSKYIAIEVGEENQEGKQENITKTIEKVQDLTNFNVTPEELKQIQTTYMKVINENLPDDKFSKIEENNKKGYQVTMDGQALKNLIIQLLETLKNDQTTLDKINEYIKMQKNSSKITASNLDNFIKDLTNDTSLNNETLKITVYQTGRQTNQLIIEASKAKLEIAKNKTGNDSTYSIGFEANQTTKIELVAKYSGLQSNQSISENYELSLNTGEDIEYQYHFNRDVNFVGNTQIEDFNENNSMFLNQMEEEQRNNFLNAVGERITAVNKKQMEQLGLTEDQNPLQFVLPNLSMDTSFLKTARMNLSSETIEEFNRKFEMYQNTNLQGVTVKGLLSTIQLNSESEEDVQKIKEIHFDGEEYEVNDQNLVVLKSNVETEASYRVDFEKDEDTGLIYRAVINKK